jgi:hypothetical protein
MVMVMALLGLAALPLAAHEHHAPHGGSLQVFGHEVAHLELVLDAGTGHLTAYALDGEAEGPVRLKQHVIRLRVTSCTPSRAPFNLTLRAVANPLTGETVGDSSQFEGAAAALKGVQGFQAVAGPVTLRGVAFASNRLRHPGGNEGAGE